MTDQPQHFGWADDAHRYRLDARIATGGMGQVWRATDTVLGREVAVKLLKNEYADDASFRTRFETEAQHAASLHHPNIAAVYDFGEATPADGSGVRRPYLVMELVNGQPLSALIRPGEPMDPIAVRGLLAQAADGLGAAHAAGIVHRDIKPANLLVTPDRQIKITDFGIARAARGVGLTQTGEVMGTPQYISPEQAQGETASPASDVYSLGVVAWECLAGRRPFVGDSPVATALAHLREPVPDLPPTVPADLATVVYRALSKAPESRFADGRAFAAALRDPATAATQIVAAPAPTSTQVMAPVPPPVPPVEEEKKRRWLWPLLLVIALVLLVVLLLWLLLRDNGNGSPDEGHTTSPSPTVTSTPPTTPSEPTTSATQDNSVRINEGDYVGRPLSEVENELGNLGLKVVSQRIDNPGNKIEDLVAGVNPTGTLQKGDTVTVTFWGPAPPPSTPTSPTTSPPAETTSPTVGSTPADTTSPTDGTASPSE